MRGFYVVTNLGVETECVSAEKDVGGKFYFPFEELPSVQVGDRVSANSGAVWNRLTNVLPEPPFAQDAAPCDSFIPD